MRSPSSEVEQRFSSESSVGHTASSLQGAAAASFSAPFLRCVSKDTSEDDDKGRPLNAITQPSSSAPSSSLPLQPRRLQGYPPPQVGAMGCQSASSAWSAPPILKRRKRRPCPLQRSITEQPAVTSQSRLCNTALQRQQTEQATAIGAEGWTSSSGPDDLDDSDMILSLPQLLTCLWWDDVQVIDVRPGDFLLEHIPRAFHHPAKTFERKAQEIARTLVEPGKRHIFVFVGEGVFDETVTRCCARLLSAVCGANARVQVKVLDGGFRAWRQHFEGRAQAAHYITRRNGFESISARTATSLNDLPDFRPTSMTNLPEVVRARTLNNLPDVTLRITGASSPSTTQASLASLPEMESEENEDSNMRIEEVSSCMKHECSKALRQINEMATDEELDSFKHAAPKRRLLDRQSSQNDDILEDLATIDRVPSKSSSSDRVPSLSSSSVGGWRAQLGVGGKVSIRTSTFPWTEGVISAAVLKSIKVHFSVAGRLCSKTVDRLSLDLRQWTAPAPTTNEIEKQSGDDNAVLQGNAARRSCSESSKHHRSSCRVPSGSTCWVRSEVTLQRWVEAVVSDNDEHRVLVHFFLNSKMYRKVFPQHSVALLTGVRWTCPTDNMTVVPRTGPRCLSRPTLSRNRQMAYMNLATLAANQERLRADIQLIDVRDECATTLTGALHYPASSVKDWAIDVAGKFAGSGKTVIFYCEDSKVVAPQCAEAVLNALEERFDSWECIVFVLEGGYAAWKDLCDQSSTTAR